MRPLVLVVDDDPAIRETLTFMLEMEGFATATAADGEEAVAQVGKLCPAVVLLDVMMPKKNGYEVCRAIKADPTLSQVRVVVVTAMGQAADKERALRAGADAYLRKPFDEEELLGLLQQFVGRGEPA